MKRFIPITLLMLLVGCSEKPKQESESDFAEDSTLVDLSDDLEQEGEMIDDLMDVVVNTSDIQMRIASLDQDMDQPTNVYYVIRLVSEGYEYMENATWYIDQSFAFRFYETTWSMEGNEGEGQFHFKNGKLICATEIESGGGYTTKTYACDGMGGVLLSRNEEAQDEKSQALSADYMKTKMDELQARYRSIVELIQNNEAIQSGGDYTISMENTETIGEQDVNETTNVTITDKLYKHLASKK